MLFGKYQNVTECCGCWNIVQLHGTKWSTPFWFMFFPCPSAFWPSALRWQMAKIHGFLHFGIFLDTFGRVPLLSLGNGLQILAEVELSAVHQRWGDSADKSVATGAKLRALRVITINAPIQHHHADIRRIAQHPRFSSHQQCSAIRHPTDLTPSPWLLEHLPMVRNPSSRDLCEFLDSVGFLDASFVWKNECQEPFVVPTYQTLHLKQ